ncbi:tyrosine-type recombinase/integrase [Nonomuraea sp. NPDC049129]|uniref:tyrosine-type recombinase/integrase n=1 Tax=Nonomuraea sp. NPDC049129 TaxID=3155272 RepID=UPI0033EF20C4
MGTVRRLSPRPETPELGAAIEAFLATIANRNTAKAYAIALRALAAEHGADAPLTDLEGEAGADRFAAWFTARWGTAAAATFNARRDALGSARDWWHDQDWLTGDPLRRIRRARTPDRTKALDRAQIEAVLTRQNLALRERTLFRMLYETAARAEEVLALDVTDLDLRNRRARVRRKGGAVDVIVWLIMFATTDRVCSPVSTAILGLESGPLFVRADRTHRPEVIRTEEGRGGGAVSAAIRIWPPAARKKAL